MTLADGEVLSADVIVAADGIHSIGRTAVLGQKLVANRSGHSAYRALVSSRFFIASASTASGTD